ncbi:MAG TPA: sterol desaturase family protein [Gammaproteobacteria bacterium]
MPERFLPEISKLEGLVHLQLSSLAYAAAFFFLLSVWVNRKHLDRVLKKLLPRSLKVNLLTYVFDTLLVAAPLAYILAQLSTFAVKHDLALIDSIRFQSIPDIALIFVVVFVADAVGYFRHRFEHSRLLWPSHVLHHSDDDMTWFTLFRFHPVNRLSSALIDMSVLLAIGFPGWAIAVNGVIRHYYGMLVHANVPWTYGAWGRVFVSPVMHRWHHVLQGKGVYSNYASIFSVFDQLFGTYYVPGPCNQPLGVKGVRHDSFFSQLIHPFARLFRLISPKKRLAMEGNGVEQ